jgi:ubiquinone biosynthesis protein Coq4
MPGQNIWMPMVYSRSFSGPRRQQLHDGIHVLTGYGTDPVGEAEVQAFLLGLKVSVSEHAHWAGITAGHSATAAAPDALAQS